MNFILIASLVLIAYLREWWLLIPWAIVLLIAGWRFAKHEDERKRGLR